MRNENLKVDTYAKCLKMTPPNQNRLMSAFYIKEGKIQVSFLQPTIHHPKTIADYKKINFEVLDNVTAQYKLEKASSNSKDTRIKSLEDIIIDGFNDIGP